MKDFLGAFLVVRGTLAPPGAERLKPAEERVKDMCRDAGHTLPVSSLMSSFKGFGGGKAVHV